MRIPRAIALLTPPLAFALTAIAGAADAVGTAVSSGDPHGSVLLLWFWLLPIGGFVCAAGFIVVTAQINLDYVRRGGPHQRS